MLEIKNPFGDDAAGFAVLRHESGRQVKASPEYAQSPAHWAELHRMLKKIETGVFDSAMDIHPERELTVEFDAGALGKG